MNQFLLQHIRLNKYKQIYWKFTWHIGPLYIFVLNCFGQCSYRYYVKTNTSCNYLVVVITKNAGYLFFSWKFQNFLWVSLPTKERQNVGLRAMFCLYLWVWNYESAAICCYMLLLWFDRTIFNTSSFTGRKIQYIFEKYIRK